MSYGMGDTESRQTLCPAMPKRYPGPGRFQAKQTAVARWNPDRSPAIGGVGRGKHTASYRTGRATA